MHYQSSRQDLTHTGGARAAVAILGVAANAPGMTPESAKPRKQRISSGTPKDIVMVRVYGIPDHDKQKSIEKTLAVDVLEKL